METFFSLKSLQVEALHASAQLHYEINMESDECDEKLASLKNYYERTFAIVSTLKDKYKTPSINNLMLRYDYLRDFAGFGV